MPVEVPGSSEGLGRSVSGEALHSAPPPALRDLDFGKLALGNDGHDAAPELACRRVAWHLANLPGAWVRLEHVLGECQPTARIAVLLEYEELLHPVALVLGNHGRSDQRETCVVLVDEQDVSEEALRLLMFRGVVPELALRVECLVPNVREFVLVELQHPTNGREVLRLSQAALK